MPETLAQVQRADSQKEDGHRGPNEGGGDEGAEPKESPREGTGGRRCQHHVLPSLQGVATVGTVGAICYPFVVCQALCQALDRLGYPS